MKKWLTAAALALGLTLAQAADDTAQVQKADATAQARCDRLRAGRDGRRQPWMAAATILPMDRHMAPTTMARATFFSSTICSHSL